MKKILPLIVLFGFSSTAFGMEVEHQVNVASTALDHPVVWVAVIGLLIVAATLWLNTGLKFVELLMTATKKAAVPLVVLGMTAGSAGAQEPGHVFAAGAPNFELHLLSLLALVAVPSFAVTHPAVEAWVTRRLLRFRHGPVRYPLMFCVGIVAFPVYVELMAPTGNPLGAFVVSAILAVPCFEYMRLHVLVVETFYRPDEGTT